MTYIGVDIGTTRTKAVLYSPEHDEVLASISTRTPSCHNGVATARDPEAVTTVTEKLIRELLERRSVDRDGVVALSIASIGEEVVVVDDHFRPICPVIPWFDLRGREFASALAFRDHGGIGRIDPSFSVFKLLWLRSQGVDFRGRYVTDLADYVLAAMGGVSASELSMDWSHASRTGVFLPESRSWNTALLSALGFGELALPRHTPSATVIGRIASDVARRTSLPVSTALVSGGHDHFCGAFACGVRADGDAFISAGTSESLIVVLADPPAERVPFDFGCYVDGQHFYGHSALPAGRLFATWQQLLYGDASLEEIWRDVDTISVGGTSRLELSPDRQTISLTDMPVEVTRAEIMHAVLQGVATASANELKLMERVLHRLIRHIRAAGPATQTITWRRVREAALGRELQVVDAGEEAALGAALLGLKATAAGRDGTSTQSTVIH